MGGKLLETIIEMGIFKSVDSVSLKFALQTVFQEWTITLV